MAETVYQISGTIVAWLTEHHPFYEKPYSRLKEFIEPPTNMHWIITVARCDIARQRSPCWWWRKAGLGTKSNLSFWSMRPFIQRCSDNASALELIYPKKLISHGITIELHLPIILLIGALEQTPGKLVEQWWAYLDETFCLVQQCNALLHFDWRAKLDWSKFAPKFIIIYCIDSQSIQCSLLITIQAYGNYDPTNWTWTRRRRKWWNHCRTYRALWFTVIFPPSQLTTTLPSRIQPLPSPSHIWSFGNSGSGKSRHCTQYYL